MHTLDRVEVTGLQVTLKEVSLHLERRSVLLNVAASVAGVTRTGQEDAMSLLQIVQCCHVSFLLRDL